MPNINQGLEQGTSVVGEEVNTESGFEAALAKITGNEERLEGRSENRPGTSIAEGLTFGEEPVVAPASSAPAGSEEEVEEETDTSGSGEEETEEETPAVDPEVAALLDKHDGDATAALLELNERRRNAEQLIGRQGQQLGEMRSELEKLGQRIDARPSTPPPLPVLNEEFQEQIDTMVGDMGGARAALWALNNRPDVYDHVIESWASDPAEARDAREFDRQFQYEKAKAEVSVSRPASQPVQPVDPRTEYVERQIAAEQMGKVLDAVSAETADWEDIKPFLGEALEESSQIVLFGIASNDPTQQTEATKEVVKSARLLALQDLQKKAREQVAGEGVRRKNAARVTSGSGQPVKPRNAAPEDDSPEARAERVKAFKERLLQTETTSVRDGLTYGK